MTRLPAAALAPLAVLALAAGASAHGHHRHHHALKPDSGKSGGRAHVFHGTFYPSRDADTYAYPGVFGHAQLVDGKKNDKLSIHVMGLQPRVAYTYSLNGSSDAHPCGPTAADSPVTGFAASYPVTSNADGVANARARSHTFTSDPSTTYYVLFKQGTNVLACAILHPNMPHHPHGGPHHHGAPAGRPTGPASRPTHPTGHKH